MRVPTAPPGSAPAPGAQQGPSPEAILMAMAEMSQQKPTLADKKAR